MVPWEKWYLEVVEVENKEKAYIARKNVLKFKRKIIQTRGDKFKNATFWK